jgi:hypothetical protein
MAVMAQNCLVAVSDFEEIEWLIRVLLVCSRMMSAFEN